jgi:hypothetical protein
VIGDEERASVTVAPTTTGAAVDISWLPLGAGASVVRFNGRVYEAIQARRERRAPAALYHAALEVRAPEGRFTVELAPVPDLDGAARGVLLEGPVGSRVLARFRVFRYELRCWPDGRIPDLEFAVDSPRRLTEDPGLAHGVLTNLRYAPAAVWGRDEQQAGEMWNSNSVISWALVRSGLDVEPAGPPRGGRAPGWDAGVVVARRGRTLPTDGRSGGHGAASSAPDAGVVGSEGST